MYKPMKIVLTDAKTVTNGDLDLSVFSKYGELCIYETTTYAQTAKRLQDADAVLLNKTVLDAKILSACPKLRYIGLFATGYNVIDTEYTRAHGITVCNAGSYSTDAVAQTVFAMILEHASRVASYDAFVKEGGWIASPTFSPFVYPTEELCGKTLGIIGCGSIGKRVAAIGAAFGMLPQFYSRSAHPECPFPQLDFETVLATSDYLTVHCPLTPQTDGMFDRAAFSKMKPGAYFINTARGGVLREQALFDALESGHLSGAAADVLSKEPMEPDCILLHAKNITFTPHVAWAPLQTRKRLLGIAEQNLAAFLQGKPMHVVG